MAPSTSGSEQELIIFQPFNISSGCVKLTLKAKGRKIIKKSTRKRVELLEV